MNNNRGNNRRRGRGNNRPQGGGQQLNRIDSRARGNAPQLLEKYRKLAHDAHLNGDRVTAEYYLQFADHYFRVIADTRLRQDEQRLRRDERWQEQPEEGDDSGEFTVESDFPAFDQPVYSRREREDSEERERPRRDREGRDSEGRDREGRDREGRDREGRRREEPDGREDEAATPTPAEPAEDEPRSIYEPPANPFVRDNRGTRGLRPRREDRRPRRAEAEAEVGADTDSAAAPVGLEAILPPALGSREEPAAAPAAENEAPPAPKRRGRKPKVVAPVEGEG